MSTATEDELRARAVWMLELGVVRSVVDGVELQLSESAISVALAARARAVTIAIVAGSAPVSADPHDDDAPPLEDDDESPQQRLRRLAEAQVASGTEGSEP